MSKPVAHLVHGFNVRDGGWSSLGPVLPHATEAGWWPELFSWGWTFTFRLAMRTATAARHLAPRLNDGDLIICHSHGYQVAQKAVELRERRVQLIAYNPAARRDERPHPAFERVLVAYSPDDLALVAGRAWRKAVSVAPWRWGRPHPWGRLGKDGPDYDDPRVSAVKLPDGTGHSGPSSQPGLIRWAIDSGAIEAPL